MIKVINRQSKSVPGLYYKSSSIGSNRYLDISYKGKQIIVSPYPVKVSKVKNEIETFISIYETQLKRAHEGITYDSDLVYDMRMRIIGAFIQHKN